MVWHLCLWRSPLCLHHQLLPDVKINARLCWLVSAASLQPPIDLRRPQPVKCYPELPRILQEPSHIEIRWAGPSLQGLHRSHVQFDPVGGEMRPEPSRLSGEAGTAGLRSHIISPQLLIKLDHILLRQHIFLVFEDCP